MERCKILYHTKDKDGNLECYCMNGFGHGYSVREANVLKAHLESKGYVDVKIVDFRYVEV